MQSLALTAIGNIASEDICRDLSAEVEKLLFHSPYIRKKAIICGIRIIKKCPELLDNYIEKLDQLLQEKNHGVLLSAVTFMSEVSKQHKKHKVAFRKLIPHLINIVKGL